ncbi:tetratricopeptide repeat protein (plasmid) [Streptomyces sp. NBC_00211]
MEIQRRQVGSNLALHERDLATYLSNLGALMSMAGRLDEALPVTEEAVEIWRRLAVGNPAAYEPDLATSLSILGPILAWAGRLDEGSTTIGEAVEIWRRLAAANLATHEPNLAKALTLRAILLASSGDLSGALQDTEEAEAICRNHIVTTPSVIAPLHAALAVQAELLDNLGRQREAQDVRRWLAANPVQRGHDE